MAGAVKKEYEASLSDLTFNSKPMINMLTMLAEENVKYAQQIVEVIEAQLQKAKPSEKLPVLYLMDSIIKNMKGSYLQAFTPNIAQTFCSVFEKVDEKTRQSLFKLRMTWSSYFPPKKLYAMDLKVKELDPAWPIVADPTAKQPAAIHVNPKFIKKPSAETPKAPQLAVAPAPKVQLTEEELAEVKKKESERQEMEMRQQLIKKQEQLLQLQQKRLEFELQQTQSKLEEQALELKQKNEQLLLQQQVLHQQQAVAAWPGSMQPPPQQPLMWPPGNTMMTSQPGVPVMPGPDPMVPMQPQQPGFLPPPPMPPFNISQSAMPLQQQQQPQQLPPPPMHPVLPMQQVPPVPQVPQTAPASRDPRVARDPRLARRDPRLRGGDQPSTVPASTPPTPLAVATVPPVQSATTASVSLPPTLTTATPNDISSSVTQQLKSVVTIAPSMPSVKPNSKPPVKGSESPKQQKAKDAKHPADRKQEAKPDMKSSEKKDTKSETKQQETKVADVKSDLKSKSEGTAKPSKSSDRSPRRTSDEKRDTRSDIKNRDRISREPERRTSRDTKKEFDKRDSWSIRERDKDSRERDRDHRDRLKERVSSTRDSSRIPSSRRRSNRSRSRSRSPVSRSRSPRGSDKLRTTATRGTKVDKFGRDIPRPVKETKEEKKPEPVAEHRKAEKKTEALPENRKVEKKQNTTSEICKKDVDERIKPKPSAKENMPGIKQEMKPNQGKSEKRRSPSPSTESDKESKTKEEAPSKRPRLDKEASPDEASNKESEEEIRKSLPEKAAPHDGQPDEPSFRGRGLRSLMELPPLQQVAEPRGWGRDHPHAADRHEHEHERMMMSPEGRRERPSPRRRLSIDPNVHIPKELSLEKHAFILQQAEKQLHSGELSHQQHQDLLRELFELHQLQRQQQDDRYEELHPHDAYLRRHLDEPRHRYEPRTHEGPRERDAWPRSTDIDRRRFPTQDVDMRVFDPSHPMHAAAVKSRGEDALKSASNPERLSLPSEDKDERILHKDRDDRVKVPPGESVLPPPPLKSILKPAKILPLDSPLSPEPAEKRGNDSKVKTEGEAVVEMHEKEEDLSEEKDKPETMADEKTSPASDVSEDTTHAEDVKAVVASDNIEKPKGKKKTKKKKKKGKGNEAEVHVEVTAFEENLEIKPPVFDGKKTQPLMDMDERRNSTDNEPPNVLPAPFREADDLEELFPAGKDRDERRGPGHQEIADRGGRPSRDGPPLEGPQIKGPYIEEQLQKNPPLADQNKESHPRDPRIRKSPLLNAPLRDNPPRHDPGREGLLGDFPENEPYRDTLPRILPYRDRHHNEALSVEGPFNRDRPPRDHLLRRSPPREGILQRGPREGPFRDGMPRQGPYRDDPSREHPYRDGSPLDGPFVRDGPPRDGPFRDGPPRDGPFRDDPPRDGPFRDGPFRDGPPRDGPFRDGPPREGQFREGHPREGSFREAVSRGPHRDAYRREGHFRDGKGREGPFRESQPRDDAFRGFPPREGFTRDGPPMERRFRDGPLREGPMRDSPQWEGSLRDGPLRDRSFRDSPPMEGPFRDGPPRERPFRDGPPMEGPFRDGPIREGSFRDAGHPRRSPPRDDDSFRGGPHRNVPYRGVHPHEGPLRESELREGPSREGRLRDSPVLDGPFRDGLPREAFIRRSPSRDEQFGDRSPTSVARDGPPREFEEHWDLRRGPPPDLREEGPNKLRPRPLMEVLPGNNTPPTEKVPDEHEKLLGMADSDERMPKHTEQIAPDHLPLPQQTVVEMIDKPPTNFELQGTLPHPQAQHRMPMNHPISLPPGLRMPNLAMLPIQVLAEQAKAKLQRGANLNLPRHLGPGMLPPRSNFQGVGLPLGPPGANFLSHRQPGPPRTLPGMAPMLQQVPGNLGLPVRADLQGQPLFEQRGIPGSGRPLLAQMLAPGMPNPALMGAPHLIQPDNPLGTPPPQQPAPLDINSLFAKLIGAGILPPTRSDSPVVPGTGTPPPPGGPKEEPETNQPGAEEDLFVPELGMYPEELKCRYEGVINRIYTGTQCSSCGMRFVIDEMDKYRKHLDWHFRHNRRDKDGVKAVQNRKWFFEVSQWLDFEEINDIDDERSNFFEEMALENQTDKDGIHCVAIDASIEGDEMCSLCHEAFEQFFDEDEEVWKLRDAVRFNKRSFHPGCYEDAKDASLLETPTPGDDGLNSSFDATVSPLSAYSQSQATAKQSVDAQREDSNQPKEPTQSADQPADSKTDLQTTEQPQSVDQQDDPPKETPNQQSASTDQVVDSKEDVEMSLSTTSQSADQVVEAPHNSQPPASAVVKTESSDGDGGELPIVVKQEVDQPMETEVTVAVKLEDNDPSVKLEPGLEPEVKMEVGSDEAGSHPQESVPDEEMEAVEAADPIPAKHDASTVDSQQPMETLSEAVSTTEGVSIKQEPVDNMNTQPDTKVETQEDITETVPTNPAEDPVAGETPPEPSPDLASSSEQSPARPVSVQDMPPSGTENSDIQASDETSQEAESPTEKTPSDLGDDSTDVPPATEEEGVPEKDLGVADEDIPKSETPPSQSEAETASTTSLPDAASTTQTADSKVEPEGQPEAEAPSGEETDAQTETNPAEASSEVRNIQAISVIGRSRMGRRDMFFR